MILLAINGTENETNGFKQTRRSCRAAQGAKAPSPLRGCDPPKAFILHREIVLTMKASFTLRAYLTIKITSIAR